MNYQNELLGLSRTELRKEWGNCWENMYDLVEDKVLKRDWLRRANHKLEERASDYFYAAVSDYLYS